MKGTLALGALLVAVTTSCTAAEAKAPANDPVIETAVKTLDGKPASLKDWRGKVVLVVNVASECGFTPQYADLEKLHERFKDKGFSVLGFPSNDFGGQEPGGPEEIRKFTHDTYGVTFPLFEKLHATGPDIAPLYQTLTTETRFPGPVQWNFTKFLVDKTGHVVARFPSETTPLSDDVIKAIDAALK